MEKERNKMSLHVSAFSGLALVLAAIFCVITSVHLIPTGNTNNDKTNYLQICSATGSCIHGNVRATTANVSNPVISENILWTSKPIEYVNHMQNAEIILQSFMGSNILINQTKISLSQSIVVESLQITESTVLGPNTSCVHPISGSCLEISNQSCNMPVLSSCLPMNATFDVVTVQNQIFLSANETMSFVPNSILNISNTLIVHDNVTISNSMNCSSSNAIGPDCINLNLFPCTNPLNATCVPTSLPFYDIRVNHTLLANQITCLGPAIDMISCFPVAGDVNGTWTNTNVVKFQNSLVNASIPLSGSGIVVLSRHNDGYYFANNNHMLRDGNSNSSVNTATLGSLGVPNGTQCLGVGQTIFPQDRYYEYYFLTTREDGTSAYYGPTDVLWFYNAVTKVSSIIGIATGFVGGDTEFFSRQLTIHPNGTLYTNGYPTGQLYQISKTNAQVTPVCYGLTSLRGSFDYYGNFFHINSTGLYKCDLTQCMCQLHKVLSISITHYSHALIGSTMYVQSGAVDDTIFIFDIRANTSNAVRTFITSPVFSALRRIANAAGIFTQCTKERQFLGAYRATGPPGFGNTTAFDPLSLNLVPSQFYFSNNGVPGAILNNCGAPIAGRKCYYPWGLVQNYCFTPYPSSGGSCTAGNLDAEEHNITNVDGVFVQNLHSNDIAGITVQNNLNLVNSAVVFADTNTSISFSPAATTTLIVGPTGSPNLLNVNNYVQARRFVSSSVALTLTAGAGAGTTTPATLTATNARRCLFQVSVTTTASPAPNTIIFRVDISGQTSFAPGIVFSPVVQTSAQLSSTAMPYVTNETINGFDFMSGSVGLAASTNYRWNFQNCI